MSRDVLACPGCDSTAVRTNTRDDPRGPENKGRHRCEACGRRFAENEAVYRPPAYTQTPRGDSIARALDDADPDDLATDGGRAPDAPTFADVASACGSANHDGGLTPPQLKEVLAEVHPVVVAQFVRRWAEARKQHGGSGAEHPQFRDGMSRVLESHPHGYDDESAERSVGGGESLLDEIRRGDAESTNGGHYVGPDRRDEADRLVAEGQVVRMQNPAGVSPVYVPMDSPHYNDDRLERMRERQSEGS